MNEYYLSFYQEPRQYSPTHIILNFQDDMVHGTLILLWNDYRVWIPARSSEELKEMTYRYPVPCIYFSHSNRSRFIRPEGLKTVKPIV